jgi:hypothetical protein
VLVGAFALSFVVYPLAFVDVTVRMDETSLAVALVVLPVAHIFAAVCPDLGSFALSEAIAGPLAVVNSSIVKLERPFIEQWLGSRLFILIILERPHFLFCDSGHRIREVWHYIKHLGIVLASYDFSFIILHFSSSLLEFSSLGTLRLVNC